MTSNVRRSIGGFGFEWAAQQGEVFSFQQQIVDDNVGGAGGL